MALYQVSANFFGSRIVIRVDIFNAKRPNRRHLRDVVAGLCPVKVGCVAGQNNHDAGRIGHQLLGVELITQADAKMASKGTVAKRRVPPF